MNNDKVESISDRLRRWADESKNKQRNIYPTLNAGEDFGINLNQKYFIIECELFHRIADDIDAEKREITERYARQSWMNPAEAIAKLANGEIEWPERTCENMAEQCFREAYNAFLCSRCGTKTAFTNVDYCPSCGAKVVSE